MKERIIEFLKQHPKGVSFYQILCNVAGQRILIKESVNELVSDGKVKRIQTGQKHRDIVKYTLTENEDKGMVQPSN